MKKLWCWRCNATVPMLEEEECRKAHDLLHKGFQNVGSGSASLPELFQELIDYHHQVTGVRETNVNVIMHHCVQQHGPPCSACGKPYRTPQASFCAACGEKRQQG